MKKLLGKPIRWLFGTLGYEIAKKQHALNEYPPDFETDEIAICKCVADYTMTGPERIVALVRAVRYLVEHNIPGDIVECGVWRGGSMMAVAHTLLRLGVRDRRLWLFDTFSGMTEPTDADVSPCGASAQAEFQSPRLHVALDEVQANLHATGYDPHSIALIAGKVEDTIPKNAPREIALLRLDTDWHESTKHELVHLFPRLVRGGVLIVDDYGYWQGARKAVEEYFREHKTCMLLNRIDFTARIGVKL
ncbi:MAG: TylF/MycF family methyltransferase [Gemmataceae bacterium]|nr:TylF/MycF family methyltransferase [Gemmataceae bacterium]MCI0742062.1 TylF/MycF family methyltransferase [Gemmataceae bacterium]